MGTVDSKPELFSSRWGMLLAMLGMAVGTGNIWRFPRIAASNGGGSFLVAWVVFLLLWSVPLLILEFGMGKGTRKGAIGAFVKTLGPNFAWMGAFIAFVATAIMFYYSVVMGWTIRFFVGTLTGEVPGATPSAFWDSFHSTPGALVTHVIAMALGVFVVSKGVRGIETAAKVLIPSLIALVLLLTLRAVTLPGASAGLAFLFTPDWTALGNYQIWIEALTQNAWDTGAGWGLVLTYAVYMRANEDTALNAFVIGFGNNAMSLLAGIMVLCTVFSVMPEAASEIVGAGNEGLTFIWVPQLCSQIPCGRFSLWLFFSALVSPARLRRVCVLGVGGPVLMDLGMSRRRAITIVGTAGVLFGIPSALKLEIFQNQDWVWGVALMLCGFFFAFAVLRYGVTKWRETFINQEGSDIHIGAWWDWAIRLVAVQAIGLTGWFLWSARTDDFRETWTLFSPYNVGSVVIQIALALVVAVLANRWLAARVQQPATTHDES